MGTSSTAPNYAVLSPTDIGASLILSELVPDRTDAILARGRDFGQSRVVCDVHWQSDVEAGRVIAAGTVARLHAEAAFVADMAAARSEIEAARASQQPPEADVCAAEDASLR